MLGQQMILKNSQQENQTEALCRPQVSIATSSSEVEKTDKIEAIILAIIASVERIQKLIRDDMERADRAEKFLNEAKQKALLYQSHSGFRDRIY